MRKTLLSLLGLLCFMIMQAQVAKTVNMTQAGTLASVLTADEKSTITDLTLTGPIDARDFVTMRDFMPLLAVLDMEGANIEAYSGSGTGGTTAYPANEIPSSAYRDKTTLKTIKLAAGITSISNGAFSGCTGLTGKLKLPAGLNSIMGYVFRDCSSLTGVEFSSGLTLIGGGAFINCCGLTGELKLPANLLLIGESAFFDCNGLTSIEFPSSLISIEPGAFYNCIGLTGELNLPAGLTSIGSAAFSGCSGLASIYIKKNVKSIGEIVFSDCSNVSKITCESETPPSLQTGVFSGINTETCELLIPQGSVAKYQSVSQWSAFKNIIEMDNPTGIITPNKIIRTWKANGQLFVKSTEEMSAAEVVDMSGRTACSISKTAYAYVLNFSSNGVYVVRIHTVNGEVKTVKVAM